VRRSQGNSAPLVYHSLKTDPFKTFCKEYVKILEQFVTNNYILNNRYFERSVTMTRASCNILCCVTSHMISVYNTREIEIIVRMYIGTTLYIRKIQILHDFFRDIRGTLKTINVPNSPFYGLNPIDVYRMQSYDFVEHDVRFTWLGCGFFDLSGKKRINYPVIRPRMNLHLRPSRVLRTRLRFATSGRRAVNYTTIYGQVYTRSTLKWPAISARKLHGGHVANEESPVKIAHSVQAFCLNSLKRRVLRAGRLFYPLHFCKYEYKRILHFPSGGHFLNSKKCIIFDHIYVVLFDNTARIFLGFFFTFSRIVFRFKRVQTSLCRV